MTRKIHYYLSDEVPEEFLLLPILTYWDSRVFLRGNIYGIDSDSEKVTLVQEDGSIVTIPRNLE